MGLTNIQFSGAVRASVNFLRIFGYDLNSVLRSARSSDGRS